MKKFLLTAISFGVAFSISACSDDSSSSTEPEKESKKSGDFSEYGSIDKDAKKILEEAIKGTDFESVECDSVSTQVVAGTNYKFQCSIKDGKKTKDIVLTVFEPLPSSDASVQLTFVEDTKGEVLFEDPVKDEGDEEDSKKIDSESGSENCTGCYGTLKSISEDVQKVLEEAIKGTDYESAKCDSVSSQVVAGTNYKFQCTIKDGKKNKDVMLTVFEPLPYTKKPAQLTLVTDADGKVLFEASTEDEGDDEEDSKKIDSESDSENCIGCFGTLKSISEDVQKVLEEAIKGTDYESAKCDSVSSQVVAGTNYKFQCTIKDGKKNKDVMLTVFEPLPYTKKPAQLTLVTDADGKVLFEASNEDEEEQEEKSEVGLEDLCDGCFGDYEDLTAADSAVFKKANKISDSTFVNPTAVSKQVVAGMNYKFKCELEVSKGETKEVILEVYENLKGEVEITAVIESNAEVLDETLDPKLLEIFTVDGSKSGCGDSQSGAVTNCDVKIGSEN